MKALWMAITVTLIGLLIGLLFVLGREPDAVSVAATPATTSATPIRIGLIPERDIFAQRKSNQILASYISEELHRPVELVTSNSYITVLKDFAEQKVDAAFLGSLVAVLAVDRFDAKVVLKTQTIDGLSTYCGVICVPESSPIRSVEDLAGRSVAMVRTTTGGNLFPICQMKEHGILKGERAPRMVWVGTHDEALDIMAQGKVDAAAIKNLRMEAWRKGHPDRPLRIIAQSGEVPENALVVRSDLADTLGRQLADVLLNMNQTPRGRETLSAYNAARFLPCDYSQYGVVRDLTQQMGEDWSLLQIEGPPPRPMGN